MSNNMKDKLVLFTVEDSETIAKFSSVMVKLSSDEYMFSLDLTKSIAASENTSITDYPVHTGLTRTSQVVIEPTGLTIQGQLSNYRYNPRAGERKSVDIAQLRKLLDFLTKNAIFIKVLTEDKTYYPVIISAANFGKSTPEMIDVNLTMREVFLFTPKLEKIAPSAGGTIVPIVDYGSSTPGTGSGGTSSGSQTGGSSSAPNYEQLALSLRSKIDALIRSVNSSDIEKSLNTKLVEAINLGVDYGLAHYTDRNWNQIRVREPWTSDKRVIDYNVWRWRDYVTVTRTWTPFLKKQRYEFKAEWAVWSPFTVTDWKSESNGIPMADIAIETQKKEITNGPIGKLKHLSWDGGDDWYGQQIRHLRNHSVSMAVRNKTNKSIVTGRFTISELANAGPRSSLQTSEVGGLSILNYQPSTRKWVVKANGFGASQLAYAYYSPFITKVNDQESILYLGIVVLDYRFYKVLRDSVKANWNNVWGSLDWE